MNSSLVIARSVVRQGCYYRPLFNGSKLERFCPKNIVVRSGTHFEKPQLLLAHYSSDAKSIEKESETLRKQFKTIYMFRHIVTAKVLSRFKIYTTAFTGVMVPMSFYLHATGQATIGLISTCVGLCTFATISLYFISMYIQKIIGMISVNGDQSKVMVSHLSFWGKRIDKVYKTEEIVPFSDIGEDIVNDLFRKMTFFNETNSLYLFLPKYGGQVVNKDVFEKIFGDLS